MHGIIRIFRWLIFLLDAASRGILHLLGLRENEFLHSTVVSMDELKQIVSGPATDGAITPPEREMLNAVINFGELVVRQVSVPRTEIIAVQADASIAEAVRTASHNGITKLPVYESNLDQITGILHLKDLLPVMLEDQSLQHKSARELVREALFVPESIPVNNLLVQMRARRQHMAITMDEFGGTAGLVTLEDLLEEIVGEVRDPFDANQPPFQQMPDGSAIVDGMSLIEDVNHFFGLQLDDPNYDTIAGYILGRLGRIAQDGDVVEDAEQCVQLRVDSMDRLRIARIHLSRL
jgi:putative hemolysin